jgi:hypothetical protein
MNGPIDWFAPPKSQPKFDKQPPFYLYHYVVRNYQLQGWEHLYPIIEWGLPLLIGLAVGYFIKH